MEFFNTHITAEAKALVMSCLYSGHLSEGKVVKQFEDELERVFGYKNCVAVNSGTSALHLALKCAGVHKGDEVILPAQTFVATGMAILYCDATPVFADIDIDTGNILVDSVSKKITEKTKAVIAVSWGGNPCELDALSEFCLRHDIFLIQDNAQALGASYYGINICEWSDFSCFSFQAIKALTCGDGGLVVCKDDICHKHVRKLRWFGIDRERDLADLSGERLYDLHDVGYKYHMNDYSAALGLGNLDGIGDRISRHREIARYYDENLRADITNPALRVLGSSDWLYTMTVDDRDGFIGMMKSQNVPVSVVHVGIDRNWVFGGIREDLVNQRFWDEHHICLPCHSGLTDDDVQQVVDAVNGGWR